MIIHNIMMTSQNRPHPVSSVVSSTLVDVDRYCGSARTWETIHGEMKDLPEICEQEEKRGQVQLRCKCKCMSVACELVSW